MARETLSTTLRTDGGQYRVMVPLANPAHEHDLIELASAIARQRDSLVDAIHIVTVPDQTSLELAAGDVETLDADSTDLLENARADAETFDVDVETHTILSHRSFEGIFYATRTHEADLVVMGWGEHGHARIEPRTKELTGTPPCDFIVLRDRGFDPSHILVPTAGGPDSDLSADIARLLRQEYGSMVTLLHVADDKEEGRSFLQEWAAEHDLEDASLQVETGEIDAAIQRHTDDVTMVIVGATERGLLARLVSGSPVVDVVNKLDCSVLLAERPTPRSFRDRLFGF